MYVMAITKQKEVDVTDFDGDDLNKYKKEAKSISWQLKWNLSSAVPLQSKKRFSSYISDFSGTTINMKKLGKDMLC